jgi:hypothetical protein
MVTTRVRHGRASNRGRTGNAALAGALPPPVSPQSAAPSVAVRVPRIAGEALAALVLVALALSFRALTLGNQFVGDPIGHLEQARRGLWSIDYLLLDTWTRPVPNLLFAVASLFGEGGAFVVPVALTAATTWWLHRTLDAWFPGRIAPLATALLMLLQMPVLQVGHLTMTEVPCYAALALGLMWFTGEDPRRQPLAYLAVGFLPLCRTEGLLIAAIVVPAFLWSEFGREAWHQPALVGRRLLLAAAPFGAWFLLGTFAAGDPAWYFTRNAYSGVASIRSGTLLWLALCNGATVLARVLPTPLLLLAFLGALSLPRHLGARRQQAWAVLLPIPALALLLSVVRAGPEPRHDFYAAGSVRLYAALAPSLVLCMAAGLLTVTEKEGGLRKRVAFVMAILMLAWAFPLDLLERAGPDVVPDAVYRSIPNGPVPAVAMVRTLLQLLIADLHVVRYGAACLLMAGLYFAITSPRCSELARAWTFRLLEPDDFKPWLRTAFAAGLAAVLVLAFPYSVQREDVVRDEAFTRLECVRVFGEHYQRNWLGERRDVVQHAAYDLSSYCGVDRHRLGAPRMAFRWASEFRKDAAEAPAGTLFLLGFEWPGQKLVAPVDRSLFATDAFLDVSLSMRAAGRTVTAVVFDKVK